MSAMVERVARAICNASAGADVFDEFEGDPSTFRWHDLARAAIEAMREPTEAMCLAPPDAQFSPNDARFAWQEMIDAALAPENQPA